MRKITGIKSKGNWNGNEIKINYMKNNRLRFAFDWRLICLIRISCMRGATQLSSKGKRNLIQRRRRKQHISVCQFEVFLYVQTEMFVSLLNGYREVCHEQILLYFECPKSIETKQQGKLSADFLLTNELV